MLREGQWQDRRLIPAEWVKHSTRAVTPVSEMHPVTLRSEPFGYGYMWWVWDGSFASGPYRGAYTASGAHGQWISVLPALDMVVVHVASWSSTGPRRSVDRPDYYRLLDLLTGRQPASEEELRKWKEAAASHP
jgi:CubicO group peptidase (beta-lactamase class C family)